MLTISVPEKVKNSIFEIPVIPQTLKRTTSAESINLDIITKLIKYSFNKVLFKAMFTFTVFEILLFEGRPALAPARRGKKRDKVSRYHKYHIWFNKYHKYHI